MCGRGILLVIISLGTIVHATENNLDIKSAYPLELQMMNLESELKWNAAESSYTRVIVWNTIPSSEDLQHHFNKFDLLQLKEKEITSGKLDIIEKSESTYERFLYAYFSEQQCTVTIFVKVNFNSKRDSFSLKNFMEKVNAALKKHGLIDKDVIVRDQIHSDNSTSWDTYIVLIVIITLLLILIIVWIIIGPSLVSFYNKNKNMGRADYNRNDYLKERQKYEEKLAIQQKSLPANHPDLAISYNNIGNVCCNMGDYDQALLSHKKAWAIREISLPQNHPDLAISYNNIGNVCYNMGDYHQALSSYKKARAIQELSLPPNHPDLAKSYNNIGAVYENMNNYSEAKSYFERAIQISERPSSENYSILAEYRKDLERVKKKL